MIKIRNKAALAWLLVLSMVLPMFPQAISSEAAESAEVAITEDYGNKTIQEMLQEDKSLTWVFAGDSITHNASWSGGRNSYSEWFEQYLYDIGRGDDSVVLTAWGGASAYDFQPEGEKFVGEDGKELVGKNDPGATLEHMITKYNPDVVFIKLGFNSRKSSNSNAAGAYNRMLDELYEDAAAFGKIPKVVLLSPTPAAEESYYDDLVHTGEREEEVAGSVKRIRDIYAGIAKERGLDFCDLRTAFLEESLRLGEDYARTFFSDSSDDGVHPNAAGQYYIFKTLSKFIGIYDETMPIYQLTYDDINSEALYVDDTYINYNGGEFAGEYGSTSGWDSVLAVNNVWAVAGAMQMSGYEGALPYRSMFRLIDNTLRYGDYRDIRLYNLASPYYTHGVSDLVQKYDKLTSARDYDVFLLLPEVPEVFDAAYEHSEDALNAYKNNVLTLLNNNSEKTRILWTPLASEDDTINGYINDYAAEIREIASNDDSILFFDANKFMNEKMSANASLKRNWFEEGANISPICGKDVVTAFFVQLMSGIEGEHTLNDDIVVIRNRNIRYTTDTQRFKGNYVRDYVKADANVSGTTVTIDVQAIKEQYTDLADIWFAVLPDKAAGNYHKEIRLLEDVADVSVSGNVYTFEAPCKNLYLAVYGDRTSDELIYRFKDIVLDVDTDKTISEVVPNPDGVYLDSLKVMSAPEFGFDKDTTEYTVNLYQYQTYATVRATAQAGLTISVNGEEVASGGLSQPIKVDDGSKIVVAVTDGDSTKTYTLSCAKPQQPDIIITEVMAEGYLNYVGTSTYDNYELVEIYNASGRELNLLDYSIGYKKDYTFNNITQANNAEYPYYFTGNDQVFGGSADSGMDATYTGIKPITKYSVYWGEENVEPEKVAFPADSTMVIWIRCKAPTDVRETLTYDTLRAALEAHGKTHTLTVDVDGEEKVVVPAESQLVVAEVDNGKTSGALTSRNAKDSTVVNNNYILDNFELYNASSAPRGWLFILKDTATYAKNGAVTEAGDDIITAAKFSRAATGGDKLSSVLGYNYDRGMSVVRNENVINKATLGEGNTSDVMGYHNLTSFGAVEYWQKPLDFGDVKAPVIDNQTEHAVIDEETKSATISLNLSDDVDLRYIELYTRKDGEENFIKTSRDFVLEACVANEGVATDIQTSSYTYTINNVEEQAEYYLKVIDGNNNVTTIGSETSPMIITANRVVQSYSKEVALEYVGIKAPTCDSEGYVFAGWYADEGCVTTPIKNAAGLTDTAYALFVSDNVLQAKAQISAGAFLSDSNTTVADLRFVTTVDSLRYKKVGFDYVIPSRGVDDSVEVTTVYNKLYAVNTQGVIDPISPKSFSYASNYFTAVTFTGIPEEDWGAEIQVTPFWETLDGVIVYGNQVVKTVNQGKADSFARIDNMYYASLSDAVKAAEDGETVIVLKDDTVNETISLDKKVTVTTAVGTTATITRGENLTDAMFNVGSEGGLTIVGTENDQLTIDGNKSVVAATESMIVNAGNFKLGTNASLVDAGNAELDYGGALYNTGTVVLEGTLSGNEGVRGGAIYNTSGNVTFNQGSYSANKASNMGAVIFSLRGTVDIKDGIFSNNEALRGGVVLSNGAVITIEDGNFTGNKANTTATYGGGVFAGTSSSTLNIKGGTFTNNQVTSTVDTTGGGVIESNGIVNISGGSFEGNAAFKGGVVFMNGSTANVGTLNISAGSFYSNTTHNETDAAGGVIYNKSSMVDITGGTFGAEGKGNIAYQRGGVIYVEDIDAAPTEANVSIKNATFSYNVAQQTDKASGGVMYVGTNSVVDIEDCTIDHNAVVDTDTSAKGVWYIAGGIYMTSATVNVTGTTFSYNKALNGGAIYAAGSTSQLTVTNSQFLSNEVTNVDTNTSSTVDGYGGAIYVTTAKANVTGTTFNGNKAITGGAIGVSGSTAQLIVTDSDFLKNTVTSINSTATDNDGYGGAIYLGNATVEVKGGSVFTENSAYRGGAIAIAGTLTLTDCDFTDNSVSGTFGRDIIYNSGSLTLSGKIGNAQIDKREHIINVVGELDSTSVIEIKQISGAGKNDRVQVQFDSASATEIGAQCVSYYGYYSTVNSGLTLQFDTETYQAIMK